MKKAILLLILSLIVTYSASAEPIKIVATTSTLEDLIKSVGGDNVDVTYIVSSGVCPDHWDLKPSQVAALNEASIIFQHGMEGWLKNVTRPDQKVIVLSGPWNTPQMAINKTMQIAAALKEADPEHAEEYDRRAEMLVERFQNVSRTLSERAKEAGTENVKVLCMEWQSGFVSWMGFDIVKTYASEEKLSLKDVNDLIEVGRSNNASIVVDNLQSGVKVGEQIAGEINATHVVLTNFPGAVEGTETLDKMILHNGESLLAAVAAAT
ncbi:MAG: metal ABC transporter substrate-binding protein [Methanothrix sp.]|nr:metal ABC transporter substrate-binding protein [Methanothrix sp.]MCX8206645.1 metal ABC transporter substrate-binding protein [Methanothrix sp.]